MRILILTMLLSAISGAASADVEISRIEELHRELGSPSWLRAMVITDAESVATSLDGGFIIPRWWVQEVGPESLRAVLSHEISHLLDGSLARGRARFEEAQSLWGKLFGARGRSLESQQDEFLADLEGLAIYEESFAGEYYLPRLWLGIEALPLVDQGEFPSHPAHRWRWRVLAAVIYGG